MKSNLETTKLKIAKSFEELLETKPMDKITVQNIIDNCSFSRQTFYRHFYDIYDLINWYHSYLNKELIEIFLEVQDLEENLTEHFILIDEHKKFYKNTIQKSSFKEFYFNTKLDLSMKYIGKKYLTEEILFELRFFWHGITNILEEWIQDDKNNISPEKLSRYICNCFPKSLKTFYYKDF